MAKTDSGAFAWVDGAEVIAVGEVPASLFDDLAAEFRDRSVLSFKAEDVTAVLITAGPDKLHLLRKADDSKGWRSTADPYVKIGAEKVAGFLNDLRDLKAERFVSHSAGEPAKYGLDSPSLGVELTLARGGPLRVAVSAKSHKADDSRYAEATNVTGVFVLAPETINKLRKSLDDFKEAK